MIKQYSRLLWWGLIANPLRTFFLLLTVIGSMTAFSSTEATLRDLATKSNDLWRILPYDLQVTGETAFSSETAIRSLPGVRSTERVYKCRLSIRTTPNDALVLLDGGILLPVTYSEGRAPIREDEIAVSQQFAALNGLVPGDTVDVFYIATQADARTGTVARDIESFTICGIAQSKIGQFNYLTEAGLQRVHSNPAQAATLLVVGDKTVKSRNIETAIKKHDEGLTITIPGAEASNDAVFTMAMTLTRTISLIMLAASVGGFYMLLALSQKERLYDLGVLRAVGLSGDQLTILLVLEGVLLILAGGALGGGILYAFVSVYKTGNLQTLLQQNLVSMVVLLGFLMGAVVYTSKATQNQSVINMMRER